MIDNHKINADVIFVIFCLSFLAIQNVVLC